MTLPAGHLFVVRGRLESVDCDVVVIPTDVVFHVSDGWRAAAGLAPDAPWATVRPDGWTGTPSPASRRGSAAGERHPQVWFANAAVPRPADVAAVARDALERIAATRVTHASGRPMPLVAMPVIGTAGGGHDARRGEVVDALVSSTAASASELGIDVVLVAASAADYAALQRARHVQHVPHDLGPKHLGQAKYLGQSAADGELAVFLGAGASIGAGLPSWDGLLERLTQRPAVRAALGDIATDTITNPLEQAELLQVVLGAVDQRGSEQPVLGNASLGHSLLGREVAAVITSTDARPSLAHGLLASLQMREAATTNYDRLYEEAVTAASGAQSSHLHDHVSVLPWDAVRSRRPWIVKMHGDVEHPDSIVLSRSAFVHYDSRWRPIGGLVQSLMLTRHLLVVGASMTDDNLLRLAHEVTQLTSSLEDGVAPGRHHRTVGTVLNLHDDAAFTRLWQGRFDVIGLENADVPDATAARRLAIFLDAVARFASPTPTHLLDLRYTADDSAAKDAARTLRRGAGRARRLADREVPGWSRVADDLEAIGASGDPSDP